jgi:hypothetical protein
MRAGNNSFVCMKGTPMAEHFVQLVSRRTQPMRRLVGRHTVAFVFAMAGCVFWILGCGVQREHQDAAVPAFRGPGALEPTNALLLTAEAVAESVTNRDTVLIRYWVTNPGASQSFADWPDNYMFRVFTQDGIQVDREFTLVGDGSHGLGWETLRSGESTSKHVVNLACMQFENMSFETLYPGNPSTRCASSYPFPGRGYYFVVIQHVPVPPPESRDSAETRFLPTLADTVLLYYVPR